MSERYLEDFAVGQTFGSGRLRIEEERIKSFAAEFDPQPFHLDPVAAQHTIFAVWQLAGGTPLRSQCASWSVANSGPQAGWLAPASMNYAGRVLCGRAMSYASRLKCSKCAHRSRARSLV